MRGNGANRLLLTLAAGGLVMALNPATVQARDDTPAAAAYGSAGMPAQAGQLKSDDYDFVTQAARIDMEEVQLGELAQKKGNSEAVRNFGARLVKDHSSNSTRLQEIATQKGAVVPSQLSQKQESTVQHLERLSGADFDQAFAKHMVKGHEHAIKEFKSAAKDASDAQLRTFAQSTLPVLEEHLRIARNLESTVKNEK